MGRIAILPEKSQQKVLGAYEAMAEQACLLLGQHEDLPRGVGETFEHVSSLTAGAMARHGRGWLTRGEIPPLPEDHDFGLVPGVVGRWMRRRRPLDEAPDRTPRHSAWQSTQALGPFGDGITGALGKTVGDLLCRQTLREAVGLPGPEIDEIRVTDRTTVGA